jgi:hypothetical protein
LFHAGAQREERIGAAEQFGERLGLARIEARLS